MQPVADPRAEGRSPPLSADATRSMGKGAARTFVLGRGLEAAGTGPTSPWLGGWADQEQQLAASYANDPGPAGALPYYPPATTAAGPSLSYPHQSRPFNEHPSGPSRPQWDVPIPIQPQYANPYGNTYPSMIPPFGNDPSGMSAFTFPPPPTPYWSPSMAPTAYPPAQSYPSPTFESRNPPPPPSSRPSQQYYSPSGPGGMVPLPAGLDLDVSRASPPQWESRTAPAPSRRASWIPGTGARPRTLSSRTSHSSDSAATHLPFPQAPHGATYPANSYSQIDPGWAGQLGSSLSSLSQQGGPFVGASPNLANEPFAFGPPSTASSSRPSTAFSDASLSGYTVQGSLGGSPPARFARLAVAEEVEPFDSPAAHPLVLFASRNRAQKEAAKLISAASSNGPKAARGARSDDDDANTRRVGRKVEHDCRCSTCGIEIAKLLFRGSSDAVSYRILYSCLECAPLPLEIVEPGLPVEGGYADQLSAAVDRLDGLEIAPKDERPPPRRERATPQRKRRAEEEAVFCDVCTRAVASGGVVLTDSHGEVPFGVEVVCIPCAERYRRCTDCGGGGGPRIGIGKWRSAALFPAGRRTCQLSHLRLPNLADMSYDIWPIEHLPPAELDEFCLQASQVFTSHMMATLATPDILESEIAMARTFTELERFSIDGWAVIEPLLRVPPATDPPVKRYLALRWAIPAHRKDKASEGDSTYLDHETDKLPSTLLRPGKVLAGFVIAEADLHSGTLMLVLTTPWATGDTFDATTILMQLLLRRAARDIEALNFVREQRGAFRYPPLEKAWLSTYFRRDSKLTTHLVNRRGFLKLEDYLSKYPETNPDDFVRRAFLPPEFTVGWHTLARKISPNDDWNARVMPPKRRRKKDT